MCETVNKPAWNDSKTVATDNVGMQDKFNEYIFYIQAIVYNSKSLFSTLTVL